MIPRSLFAGGITSVVFAAALSTREPLLAGTDIEGFVRLSVL